MPPQARDVLGVDEQFELDFVSIARHGSMTLEYAAHSLKGTVSSFGAQAAREAALRLEVVGRSGDLTYAEPACAELEKEIASLSRALANIREKHVM